MKTYQASASQCTWQSCQWLWVLALSFGLFSCSYLTEESVDPIQRVEASTALPLGDRSYLGFLMGSMVPFDLTFKVGLKFNDVTQYPSGHCQKFINRFIVNNQRAGYDVFYSMHPSFILVRTIKSNPVTGKIDSKHLAVWNAADSQFSDMPNAIIVANCMIEQSEFRVGLF